MSLNLALGTTLALLGSIALLIGLPVAAGLAAREMMSEKDLARTRARHRGSPGGTKVTEAERRRIQQAPREGGTGDIINININGDILDGEDLGRKITKWLRRKQKRDNRSWRGTSAGPSGR